MDMGTKPSFNVLMSSSPMILISRSGHLCICFVALKRNYLGNHKFCLSLNPKMHFSNISCEKVCVV
jgi:hypothetical protein